MTKNGTITIGIIAKSFKEAFIDSKGWKSI